ncbi:N-acetyl sugar amidotransferase [Paracoccaceae bacterium]|nr:N-acetyl sugar amidotransferase [Paracoccaceae bacterium]
MKKNDVLLKYNLPKDVKFCKKCTISNQRPRITFDKNGVCSACNFAETKRATNWKDRELELKSLLDKHRSKDGRHDVIVPCSGGKDGSYVAHQLKYVYGMNPLTVTFSPLSPTEIGKKNLQAFVNSGFVNIFKQPDGDISRRLVSYFSKSIGDPFQPFIYGQSNFPMEVSVNYKIPLIMYGENGEVEYGGDMKNANVPTRQIDDHVKHYFSGVDVADLRKEGFSASDLFPYLAPDREMISKAQTEIHFFSYYKFWDPQENYYYCSEKTGFNPNPIRSEGTYSTYASLDDEFDGYHYYLGFIKFGIGRTTSDTSHEIRDGKITREEGINLVKKYDGEFPSNYYKKFLQFCMITDTEFQEIVDSWRSDHIWQRDNEGNWQLKHPIWTSD